MTILICLHPSIINPSNSTPFFNRKSCMMFHPFSIQQLFPIVKVLPIFSIGKHYFFSNYYILNRSATRGFLFQGLQFFKWKHKKGIVEPKLSPILWLFTAAYNFHWAPQIVPSCHPGLENME